MNRASNLNTFLGMVAVVQEEERVVGGDYMVGVSIPSSSCSHVQVSLGKTLNP